MPLVGRTRFKNSIKLLRDPAVIGLDRGSIAWPLVSVAALAIIGSAWLAFFNGRRLVRMLQELNQSTARISQGDYTQPVQTLRRDELGDLGFGNVTSNVVRHIGLCLGLRPERLQQIHICNRFDHCRPQGF
jgi:methyl-accepting chemotaxis protein